MSASHARWLRRLSDYHSGGVSDDERTAVETHLRDCSECQEALAMYRRLYALARSPLRLGPPRFALQHGGDPTVFSATPAPGAARPAPTWPPLGEPPRGPHPRRRVFTGIAAAVAAALVVAGFLVALGSRGGPSVASTPSPKPVSSQTVAAAPTATPGTSPTAAATPASTSGTNPSSFVCANPAGSSMVYAYQNDSGAIFTVTGCTAPKLAFAGQGFARPLAWSPSNRYLAVVFTPQDGQSSPVADRVLLLDPQQNTSVPTHYTVDYGPNAAPGQTYRIFLGWLDDATFVGAVVPIVSGQTGAATGPASIVRVDVASQQETKVATVTWFADAKVSGGGKYLFYGGYQSASEGQGFVHRLDLTTGQDTKLAPLGFAGQGGCQGTPICNWTASWDVRADGTGVVYHLPGPTKPWSDTYQPPDSPVYLDNLSGASPVQPIDSKLAASLTSLVLSPDADGAYLATPASSYDTAQPFSNPQTGLTQIGSSTTTVVDGTLIAWRGDSRAVVLTHGPGLALYDLATGSFTPLQSGTNMYLWGN